MPRKVALLLLFLAFSTLLRVVEAADTGDTSSWIAVAINVLFIVGLMRGSEGARAILRGFAGLGFVLTVIGTALLLMSGILATTAGMFALLVIGYSVVVCGFMYWCLGQEDVIAWITARRIGADPR